MDRKDHKKNKTEPPFYNWELQNSRVRGLKVTEVGLEFPDRSSNPVECQITDDGLRQLVCFRNDNGNRNRDLKKLCLDAFTLRMRKSEEVQGCSSQMA